MDKDYYRILGVLDDAEDIVIKAAYRALAQKYHPDRWQGNPTEATRRMAEINAAYAVLSDPDKRREYDAIRDKSDFQDDSADADDSQDAFAAIDKDWAIATKYKPELIEIEAGLRRIARELGTTYKLILLEHKNFDDYEHAAEVLERVYLKKYFGSTQIAQDFGKQLILERRKDAARELNQVVRVLGSCDELIVHKIASKFGVGRFDLKRRIEKLKAVLEAFNADSLVLQERLQSFSNLYGPLFFCRFSNRKPWEGGAPSFLEFFQVNEVTGKETILDSQSARRVLSAELDKLSRDA
jgi:DnaJ-domain-containing protein 1